MKLRAKLSWIIVPTTLVISLTLGWLLTRFDGKLEAQVVQAANRSLATNLVAANLLYPGGQLDRAALDALFGTLMVVNPSIEIYLLKRDGTVYMHGGAEHELSTDRVDVQPVHAFLDTASSLPIRGTDPRNPTRDRIFSVAPVEIDGERFGYLYLMLTDPLHGSEAPARGFRTLVIVGLATAGITFLGLVIGIAVVRLITRRVAALDQSVNRFRHALESSTAPSAIDTPPVGAGGPDELDSVAAQTAAMSETILQQLDRLQSTDRLRRQLIANVSHDLRTPLSAVEGYLQTVLVKGNKLDGATQRQYVQTAYRSARRLGGLIAELFELSRLEAQDRKLAVETFNVAELVSDVIQKLAILAGKRQVILDMTVDPEAAQARGEIGLIERVLDNLIVNAIQHSPPGGRVLVTLRPDRGKEVQITVSDEGAGIGAEDLPHIFDRFFRPSTSGVQQTPGAGLGLAIVRRIIELHGTRVTVRSELGRGSAFAFWLTSPDPSGTSRIL